MENIQTVDTDSSLLMATATMREQLEEFFESLREHSVLEDSAPLVRFELPIPSLSPIDWLAAQISAPRVYWSDRDANVMTAGLGISDSLSSPQIQDRHSLFKVLSARLSKSDKSIRYFGGFSFALEEAYSLEEENWEEFGHFKFILPRFEVVKHSKGTFFCCNLNLPSDIESKESIFELLDQLTFDPNVIHELAEQKGHNSYQRLSDSPDRQYWDDIITTALEKLDSNPLEKIVLARQTEIEFDQRPDPTALLRRLQAASNGCFHFLFQFADSGSSSSFMGASPELLYRRNRNSVNTEAVAGTRPRSDDPKIDESLAAELLGSEKDVREHHYVVRSVVAGLKRLCQSFGNGASTDVLKLARVQHLVKRYRGELMSDFSDSDILATMHPTPAVGGFPTADAIELIEELEPFHRGWYAGPVGWVSADEAEFAVAIRSGLLSGKNLTLFSGAGIVQGSDPEQEWNEVEGKISNFISALDK